MKFLRLKLGLPPSMRHPMHEFVVAHEEYNRSKLLHWHAPTSGGLEMIFHVDGPQEQYSDTLDAVDEIQEYYVSSAESGFYLYVRELLSPQGASIVGAFDRVGIIIAPPVTYRADGSMRVSVIGESDAVQTAVADVPDELDVDVLKVSRYDAQPFETGTALTTRQREAVRAAVECGYYQSPREGTVSDVSDMLGCSSGTAAEHLRKAEATIMQQSVEPRA